MPSCTSLEQTRYYRCPLKVISSLEKVKALIRTFSWDTRELQMNKEIKYSDTLVGILRIEIAILYLESEPNDRKREAISKHEC